MDVENAHNAQNAQNAQNEGNDQIYIAIEKYLLLIMLEFQEHLGKYKNLYGNISFNTKEYFSIFEKMIFDYCEEINQNQSSFYDLIAKLNSISEELPKLEEFYLKVKEMRLGLEKMQKLIKTNLQHK